MSCIFGLVRLARVDRDRRVAALKFVSQLESQPSEIIIAFQKPGDPIHSKDPRVVEWQLIPHANAVLGALDSLKGFIAQRLDESQLRDELLRKIGRQKVQSSSRHRKRVQHCRRSALPDYSVCRIHKRK